MKAIILVGGEGTRLRPLTYDTPKQLLPMLGTPMLEQVFAHLASHGIDEVVLSLGYLPDRFIETYPDGHVNGVKITYVVEPAPLDTAGAIRFAAVQAGVTDTFVVVNGDVLTNCDLSALIAFHRANEAVGTIALHAVEDPSRFGVVVTDGHGKVLAFVEKPPRDEAPTNRINAGIYVFDAGVIDHIAAEGRVSVERDTFPKLAAAGVLFAKLDDAYWLDTGTPTTFIQCNVDRLRMTDVAGVTHGNWVHPSAQVDPSALVRDAVVDAGCVVGPHAVLEQSVMMPGSVLEAGATVHRAIVSPGSVVRAADVVETDSIFDTTRS